MANRSSKIFLELTKDEINSVMASVFPDAIILSYDLCSGGLFNTTYRIELKEDREFSVILRVGPIHRELLMGYEHDMMQSEAAVFGIMQENKIPCSRVLAVCTDRSVIDRDYMVVECIDGVALSSCSLSDEERYQIDRECGHLLRLMHEIPLSRFGRATDVLFGGGYDNFFESVYAEICDLCDKCEQDGFLKHDDTDRILRAVMRHKDVLLQCKKPILCHGDMWSGNVLVSKKDARHELAAIIDVDRAYFGDPAFDLGNPWIITDAFLDGYGITRDELEAHGFTVRRKVSTLIYFLIEAYVWHRQYDNQEYAENGKRAALDTVAYLEEQG